MTTVIPAIGARYLDMALAFRESMTAHGWDTSCIILSDISAPGCTAVESADPRGKDVKTGFARHLPPGLEGEVILADADMLATGPMPDFGGPGEVRSVRLWSFRSPRSGEPVYDSFLTWFDSAATARRFGALWGGEWGRLRPHTDVPAYNVAARYVGMAAFPSRSVTHPFPGLEHLRGRKPRAPHCHATIGQ